MKRKAKPTNWTALTPFSLYPADIREIHRIIAEVAPRVVMETGDYSDIESADELFSLQDERLRALTLGGYRGVERVMEVRLDKSSASVWVADDSAELVGALSKVQRVCWRHVALFPGWVRVPLFAIGLAVVVSLLGTVAGVFKGEVPSNWPLWAGIGATFATFGAVMLWRARLGYVRIYLHPRTGPGSGLLAGHRDDWIIGVVSGVIVGALFFVLGLLVR